MRVIGGTGDKANLTGPVGQAGVKMNLVGLLDGIRCKV